MAQPPRSTTEGAGPRARKRPISLLPNALTLANAGLGLLAISKAIDALADPANFGALLEVSCWLVLAAGVFDALDGKVARLTNSFSDLGAQLDSLADALTFGVAPALIGKVLLEHQGYAHPRVNFIFAAAFSLMAILRLARFNVEDDEDDDHSGFRGLPSPAAAGMLVITVLMFLSLNGDIEHAGGQATPLGRGLQFIPAEWRAVMTDSLLIPTVLFLMPFLALLMVSRVRYAHLVTRLGQAQSRRALIPLVFGALGLYLAPVLVLFVFGVLYVTLGIWFSTVGRGGADDEDGEARDAA